MRIFRFSVIALLTLATAVFVFARSNPVTHDSDNYTLMPRVAANKPPGGISIHPDADIGRVVVKLVAGTRARLSGGSLVSLTGRNLQRVNEAVRDVSPEKIQPLVSQKSPQQIEKDQFAFESISGHELADFNNYYVINVSSPAQAEALVDRLNALPEVEIAYPEPVPTPAGDIAPPTPDYSGGQDYLRFAPVGVDADYANTVTGGDGTGVKIVDIEGDWKFDHEDLDPAVGGLIGGTLLGSLSYRNHGTAVIGEMIGQDNGYGITGIVPQADIGMVSIGTIGTTEAIITAADNLQPGDVILIELHAPGPHYDFQVREDQQGYVCMEYWQSNYDAIQYAWAKGVIVCEAAGNGREDYDDDTIYENKFDTTFRNSHAIICGAGNPPSGAYGTDLARSSFSNYGERVNVQGYGNGVVTTGYGGLFDGGGDERQFYTGTFSGTSSASPIITGSVAAVQGIHKARYGGRVMTADQVRELLVATGSPQQGNTSEHVGPRPDLEAADLNMPAPPPLSSDPLFVDEVVQEGTQLSVYVDLINHSNQAIDFDIPQPDSFARAIGTAPWLVVPVSTGTIAPLSTYNLEIVLDATIAADRVDEYKGLVKINHGPSGGSLDEEILVPVFMDVPCVDNTYTASFSENPDGPTYSWVDISTIGNMIAYSSWHNDYNPDNPADDGTAGPIAIGFSFPFYETDYTTVYIGANGALSFTNPDVNINGFFGQITIPGAPWSTTISAFWNDLNPYTDGGGHGAVYTYRSAANDSFVVQYDNVGNFNDPADSLTFEIILERNGSITMQYNDVGTTGMDQTAVIGISEIACKVEPFVNSGDPVEDIVSDATSVLFDYQLPVLEQSGDADSNGTTNIADAVFIVNWVFKGGPAPADMNQSDVNCSGGTDISDAVWLIDFVFKGGDPPCYYEL